MDQKTAAKNAFKLGIQNPQSELVICASSGIRGRYYIQDSLRFVVSDKQAVLRSGACTSEENMLLNPSRVIYQHPASLVANSGRCVSTKGLNTHTLGSRMCQGKQPLRNQRPVSDCRSPILAETHLPPGDGKGCGKGWQMSRAPQ
ncbi:hypothetical protein J6590_029970 [Homalodisca vitripennis]|nr:hypothetical protein J6590_029970 [Homalodisca vitripennis]